MSENTFYKGLLSLGKLNVALPLNVALRFKAVSLLFSGE
jgi:hypothetical protein